MIKLTEIQREILIRLLKQALKEMTYHSCNDFELVNTQENLQFAKDMIAVSDYPDEKPYTNSKGTVIIMDECEVMQYFIRLIQGG